MMRFLAALIPEYESINAQILSSPEISSFQETFSRILRTETSSSTPPSAQMSSALMVETWVSLRSNNIEVVVPTVTLEGQALEELFVIIAISLDM